MIARVPALLALLSVTAACSKQEPPAAIATTPPKPALAESAGGSLPPDKTDPSGPEAPPPSQATPPALIALPDGPALFSSTCATCHMADGGGVPYLQPSIKGSAWISQPDPQLLLSLILRGSVVLGEGAKAFENDMAPQDALTDAEVAAIATYVRQRFAAAPIAKPVTPAEVAVARARPGLPP